MLTNKNAARKTRFDATLSSIGFTFLLASPGLAEFTARVTKCRKVKTCDGLGLCPWGIRSINSFFSFQFYEFSYCHCKILPLHLAEGSVWSAVSYFHTSAMFRSTLSRGFARRAPSATIRPFSSSSAMAAAVVKKLGVVGAGQMVKISSFVNILLSTPF